MFWDKGYTPSQNIEALLEKENATVEEFLDDEDILQECKSQKKSIVNYFTRPDVIKRLVQLITTEPSEQLPMVQRFRHANMACEILALGLPSLDEKLLSDIDTFKTLYSYLENEPPLNPLLSSFFSKTFSMLFTKKPEQDWFLYQQMCLKLLEYIKSEQNFLDLICKHFSTPIIPDLVMQMMRDVEGGQLKRNLYEWLTEDKLVERLIAILGSPDEVDKHANVSEFLCDLIQQGRTMRQTEYENDSFEPAFEGSNPILKAIESVDTIEALLNVILEPNAHESAIVSGISVVLTLIKPLVFVEEPNSDRMKHIQNREKEIHENIIVTVIRVIAPRLKDFHKLLTNPPNKPEIVTTAARLKPPFGVTRLQICRLFTVLLQTHNEEISKAICETDYFETLLKLFKQYCWNNFLHSEVEKSLELIFYTQLRNTSTQGSTIVNDGSFGKNYSNDMDSNTLSFFDYFKTGSGNGAFGNDIASYQNITEDDKYLEAENPIQSNELGGSGDDNDNEVSAKNKVSNEDEAAQEGDITVKDDSGRERKVLVEKNDFMQDNNMDNNKFKDDDAMQEEGDINDIDNKDITKTSGEILPSALQTHVIENCKIISKLIDCWQHNRESESAERGRRLGYMGHLIKIFKHITSCISESEHIGALIESNLKDASELELWQSIINPTDGDFTMALATQSRMLANCNAHETGDYSQNLPKDFLTDNSTWDYIMSSNINNLGAFNDPNTNDIVFALDHDIYRNDDNMNADHDRKMFDFCRNVDDEDDDDDDENGMGDGHSLFTKPAGFRTTCNPWEDVQPFSNGTPWSSGVNSDGFADFDSYFNTFASDMGESLAAQDKDESNKENDPEWHLARNATTSYKDGNAPGDESYDNNANVEQAATTARLMKMPSVENLSKTEDDDNAKNEKVATSLVLNLQSVMQDSDDDYEDDEGMWTKPLGGNETARENKEEDEQRQQKDRGESLEIANDPKFTNGRSSNQTTEDNAAQYNAQLNNSKVDGALNITSENQNITIVNSEAVQNENENLKTNELPSSKDTESPDKETPAAVDANLTEAATLQSTATPTTSAVNPTTTT